MAAKQPQIQFANKSADLLICILYSWKLSMYVIFEDIISGVRRCVNEFLTIFWHCIDPTLKRLFEKMCLFYSEWVSTALIRLNLYFWSITYY